MKCNNCDTILKKDDKFCPNCGTPVVHPKKESGALYKFSSGVIYVFLFFMMITIIFEIFHTPSGPHLKDYSYTCSNTNIDGSTMRMSFAFDEDDNVEEAKVAYIYNITDKDDIERINESGFCNYLGIDHNSCSEANNKNSYVANVKGPIEELENIFEGNINKKSIKSDVNNYMKNKGFVCNEEH